MNPKNDSFLSLPSSMLKKVSRFPASRKLSGGASLIFEGSTIRLRHIARLCAVFLVLAVSIPNALRGVESKDFDCKPRLVAWNLALQADSVHSAHVLPQASRGLGWGNRGFRCTGEERSPRVPWSRAFGANPGREMHSMQLRLVRLGHFVAAEDDTEAGDNEILPFLLRYLDSAAGALLTDSRRFAGFTCSDIQTSPTEPLRSRALTEAY